MKHKITFEVEVSTSDPGAVLDWFHAQVEDLADSFLSHYDLAATISDDSVSVEEADPQP